MESKPMSPLSNPNLKRYLLDAEYRQESTLHWVNAEGQRTLQTWEAARFLGQGTFGQVRQERLRDTNGDWHYRAVKACPKALLHHARVDYVRELSALAALSSSKFSGHFVNLIGWWEDSINLYIATEYISRSDLSTYINAGLSEQDTREVIEDVLDGLKIMHDQGFTHRDIKPKNILVVQKRPEFQRWWVKIADFGVSKRVVEESGTELRTTFGTRHYFAPEVLGYLPQNMSAYSNKVDIWSLGCVLFNISSRGHMPFSEPELVRYCDGTIQFNPQKRHILLGEHGTSILKAFLQPNPDHRPSASDALNDPWFKSTSQLPRDELNVPEIFSTPKSNESTVLSQNERINYNSFLQSTLNSHAGSGSYEFTTNTSPTSISNKHQDPTYANTEQNTVAQQHLTAHKSSDTVPPSTSSLDSSVVASTPVRTPVGLWDIGARESQRPISGYHGGLIIEMDLSSKRQLLASASDNGTIGLWDAATGKLQRELSGHSNYVRAVAFSFDGQHLACGFDDKVVRIWNTATGDLIRKMSGHLQSVISVAFSNNGELLASGSVDKMVKLWSTATGDLRRTMSGHAASVGAVAFSPDGKFLASGSQDDTIRLWDAVTGQHRSTLRGHKSWVWRIAFSPDKRLLVSASLDRTVRLWDLRTRAHRTLAGHTGYVSAIAFSPSGRLVASGSYDSTVKLWGTSTGLLLRTMEGHTGAVMVVAFSPDGHLLGTGSKDKTVRVWKADIFPETPERSCTAIAQYTFNAVEEGQLGFSRGDVLSILRSLPDSAWWIGKIGDEIGNIPRNYVKVVSPDVDDPPKAKARYAFESNQAGYLSFVKDQVIKITEVSQDSDWWVGRIANRSGRFPRNYVELM